MKANKVDPKMHVHVIVKGDPKALTYPRILNIDPVIRRPLWAPIAVKQSNARQLQNSINRNWATKPWYCWKDANSCVDCSMDMNVLMHILMTIVEYASRSWRVGEKHHKISHGKMVYHGNVRREITRAARVQLTRALSTPGWAP